MICEIISGIWSGNADDIYDKDFYNDNLISIVLNCSTDLPFQDIPELKKVRIPISVYLEPDKDISLLKKNMESILDYIHKHKETHNIFIYGYSNHTIPSLLLSIYLVKYGNIPKTSVIDVIRSKNKDVILDMNLSTFL